MVAMNMPDVNLSRSREKDFPYFRRLWKSVVVALLVASFVPLLGIGGGMYAYTVSVLEDKTLESLRMEMEGHKQALDEFLGERTADLKLLSSNLEPDDLTRPGALEKVFRSLRRELPCFTDLGIIDDQGRHLAYVGPYDLSSKNYREAPWFMAMKERGVYISDVFLGFRKEPHFIIAVRNESAAGFWIMRTTVDTGFFYEMVSKSVVKRRGDSFLINQEGIFQTSPRLGGQIMGQSEFRNPEFFEGVRTVEGRKHVALMAWLEKVPWLYVVELDREEIDMPLKRMRHIGILVFVLGGIVILATVLLTTNSLIGRLEKDRRDIHILDHHLRQSSKAASSMHLAPGFVGEINESFSNIDLVLRGIDDLAQGDLSGEESRREIRERLKQVRSELVRGRRATEQFLKTTQSFLPVVREVKIQDILEEIIELLDRELHFNRITVRREYQEPLPWVRTDPSQLREVLQNLVVNALKAIGKDGVLTLTLQAAEEKVTVAIADTGPGIPQKKLERIFDPLFTAQPDATGLGLSIGAGILKKLGGTISVESELGKGSVFTVKIPTRFSPPEA